MFLGGASVDLQAAAPAQAGPGASRRRLRHRLRRLPAPTRRHRRCAQDWSVSPTPYFFTGTGSTFDLNTTLPAGVRKGGTFAVVASGAPLPAGMALSHGLLSVGNAEAGRADGVIFTYAEPAG